MIANYHTHTKRCRHAEGTEREYIETAITRGLKTLGFSDHCPYTFPGGYYSTYRMYPEQTEDYFVTIESLRREYKDDIEILIGLESEYYPAHFDAMLGLVRQYKPDYMILGQHFVQNEYDGTYSGNLKIDEKLLDQYVSQTLDGLKTGVFTFFAHPDLIRYPEDDEIYAKHIRRLCEGAKALGIPLELNLLGLSEGRHYPRENFWRIASEIGNEVVLGCDAHKPDAVANPADLKAAYEFAAKFGITPLDRIKLRKV